jgi:diguanylate cyclase (GGDEF)-like protein
MTHKAVLRLVLLSAFAFFVLASAGAQDITQRTWPTHALSDKSPGRFDIGTGMEVLVDESRAQTLEQVRLDRQPWQTIAGRTPNFGFTKDAYWFRFQLNNTTGQTLARLVELPIPFLDDVQLFHFVGNQLLKSYATGDEMPYAMRTIRHPNFVMPLQLAPGMNQLYLRLESSGSIEASLRVWDPVTFQESSNSESLLQGGLVGVLLIMIVYNLFVYLSTRDLNYLYYIGFVTSYLFFHFTLNGYAFAYLWPNAIRWNSFAISTFIASTAFFACIFANGFLKLRQFSRLAFRTVSALAIASGVILVLSFVLPYSFTVRAGAGLVVPVSVVLLSVGYWRWWRGAKFARFYCLAWTAALVGVSMLGLGKWGLIPANVWTNSADQVGLTLLVTLLSFTLADRINHDRTLRVNAQAVALAHERQARAAQQAMTHATEAANRELEQRVAARTADLNAAIEQLKVANDRLQLLSTVDGLTQLSNRAFFDSALLTEHRRATRLKTPLALIMFDIDHFKQVNDTYGHLGGDACLRALARLVQPRIHRAGDVLARYGGEEFVILLIDSNLENTMALVETLRSDIENLRVAFEGGVIQFTASFGLACAVPDATHATQDFLAAADKALYQAKHEGRNCVRNAAFIQPTQAA